MDNSERVDEINRSLSQSFIREVQRMQIERAILLNLTLYRLTPAGKVEPISARNFFAAT